MDGKSHLPTPGADVQLRLPTCDVCGPAEDDVHRLEGPAGDVVVCDRCVGLLVELAGPTT